MRISAPTVGAVWVSTYWIVSLPLFRFPTSPVSSTMSFFNGARTCVSSPEVDVASVLMPSMAAPIVVRSCARPVTKPCSCRMRLDSSASRLPTAVRTEERLSITSPMT